MTITKTPGPETQILLKVWITKYALTTGVFTATNAEVCDTPTAPGSMIGFDQSGVFQKGYAHKPHWHETEEEARAQVAKMIASEKKSLAKKIAKLEKLELQVTSTEDLPSKPWDQ